MLKTLDGSIISLIVLLFLLIHSNGLTGNRQNAIYKYMTISNMALIIVDLMTWFLDGRQGTFAYIAIHFSYFMLYFLPLIPSFLFTMYIYDLIQEDILKHWGIMAFYAIIIAINTVMTILSLTYGLYFVIEANNTYRRGSYVFLLVIFSVLPFAFSIFILCKNRKRFNKRYFYTLLATFAPQTAGIIIQFFNYGYTTNWIGMMISLLIVYMNIQSLNLNTDYLTGVNNRRYLEETVSSKICRVSKNKTFVAIMLDIDDFKLINDNFGHDTGDNALKDFAQILKSSIRNEDFVARIAGDEFMVITDIHIGHNPQNIVKKIYENVDIFNNKSARPYTLNFSAGYHMYDYESDMSAKELLRVTDKLMYENKKCKGR